MPKYFSFLITDEERVLLARFRFTEMNHTDNIKRVYSHQLQVSLEHRQVQPHPLDPGNKNNKMMMNKAWHDKKMQLSNLLSGN